MNKPIRYLILHKFWARTSTLFILGFVSILLFQNCGRPRTIIQTDAFSTGQFAAGATDTKDVEVAQLCGDQYAPGHTQIHRLSNDEFSNTVQDLLFTSSRPGDVFPQTSIGNSGFKNDSAALDISSEFVTRLYEAAETLATEVLASKSMSGGAYSKLVTCAAGTSQDACITKVVRELGSRAYRRPLVESGSDNELARLTGIFKQPGVFDTGLHDLIVALLVDPKFLFVYVSHPQATDPNAQFFVSNFELASRLSYFLWQSMPDDQLLSLARANQLSETSVLKTQIQRMLKHAKAANFVKVLKREWAGLGKLESNSIVGLDDNLRASMSKETELFLQDMIATDKSMISVLNANYTFMNKTLADHYGASFTGTDPSAFVKVTLNNGRRIGLVTQASVLTNTAGSPDVTHPVRRGFWVTERIYCQPPGAPPAIQMLDHTPSTTSTIRERLAEHTKRADCNYCHKLMDPFGLGLENYDPFGKWRTTYGTLAIDASGKLPDETPFTTPVQMYSSLTNDPQVKGCLVKQVMSYASSRALAPSGADDCVTRAIGQLTVRDDKTFSDMISRIVFSRQFRMQTGEGQ